MRGSFRITRAAGRDGLTALDPLPGSRAASTAARRGTAPRHALTDLAEQALRHGDLPSTAGSGLSSATSFPADWAGRQQDRAAARTQALPRHPPAPSATRSLRHPRPPLSPRSRPARPPPGPDPPRARRQGAAVRRTSEPRPARHPAGQAVAGRRSPTPSPPPSAERWPRGTWQRRPRLHPTPARLHAHHLTHRANGGSSDLPTSSTSRTLPRVAGTTHGPRCRAAGAGHSPSSATTYLRPSPRAVARLVALDPSRRGECAGRRMAAFPLAVARWPDLARSGVLCPGFCGPGGLGVVGLYG